ncbi:MAG: bifunctional nuclease family protein [Clostridia bacterium]|nr:bifunctional nuclease family protein [Clostridia bacterium]
MVQMQLVSVGMVGGTDDHLMVLKEAGGNRLLVISIGVMEATAIAVAVEGIEPPRPMTHDLLAAVIRRLQAELTRVVIHDLRNETFIGQLDLRTEKGVIEVDCRPSDAVALAVRTGAPIYVTEGVLEAAAIVANPDGEEA